MRNSAKVYHIYQEDGREKLLTCMRNPSGPAGHLLCKAEVLCLRTDKLYCPICALFGFVTCGNAVKMGECYICKGLCNLAETAFRLFALLLQHDKNEWRVCQREFEKRCISWQEMHVGRKTLNHNTRALCPCKMFAWHKLFLQ